MQDRAHIRPGFREILAAARSQAPSVIIFRLRNQTPAAVNPRLFCVIGDCRFARDGGALGPKRKSWKRVPKKATSRPRLYDWSYYGPSSGPGFFVQLRQSAWSPVDTSRNSPQVGIRCEPGLAQGGD